MVEEREKSFVADYRAVAQKLIYIIENAKFTRNRREGYDPDQVDDFLDWLIIEIDKHGKPYNMGALINTTTIAEVRFDKTKKGYDLGELDDFLDLLEMEVEGLNGVKLRYM